MSLTRWYSINDVEEHMECAGCLTKFQPPVEAPFSYKLNELLSRGISQGSVPVLLTLLFLEKLTRKSFMYVPGLLVKKRAEKDIDIDIVASCDGHLVLSECKDLREHPTQGIPQEISAQLERLTDIAYELKAGLVFLSTMLPGEPVDLEKKVAVLNKRHESTTSVHLLTLRDLESGERTKSHPPGSTKDVPMDITDFLPQASVAENGWVKKPGERTMSF